MTRSPAWQKLTITLDDLAEIEADVAREADEALAAGIASGRVLPFRRDPHGSRTRPQRNPDHTPDDGLAG